MISDNTASTIRSLSHLSSEGDRNDQLTYDDFVAASLELSEIIYCAVRRYFSPPQTQDCSVGHAQFLEPSTTEENMAHILRFDGCLRRWENSLPRSLKYGSSSSLRDASTTRQAAVLHLR